MAIKDKHDPRDFEQYAKLADDGSVVSIHMVTANEPPPDDAVYAKVTELGGIIALDHLKIDPAMIATVKQARKDLAAAALNHAQAFMSHAAAERTMTDAVLAAARG